jgi:hypothetical protein
MRRKIIVIRRRRLKKERAKTKKVRRIKGERTNKLMKKKIIAMKGHRGRRRIVRR